jgi:hypothetical protein
VICPLLVSTALGMGGSYVPRWLPKSMIEGEWEGLVQENVHAAFTAGG